MCHIFFIAERSGSSEHGRKHDTSTCSFNNNYLAEMCSGSEEGSYVRLIDVCSTQL